MRIDGSSPIPQEGSQPAVREAKPAPAPEAKATAVQDQVDVHPKAQVSTTNVVVEMQPGNIAVYKFVDERSGQVIEQIPSQQMLDLSKPIDLTGRPTKPE